MMPERAAALWMLGVFGLGNESVPAVGIQPDQQAEHTALATRLRRGGWKRVYKTDWDTGRWPESHAGALDVVDGRLVRLTTGAASVYTGEPMELTPMWRSAARERRAVVTLLEPGTLDPAHGPEDLDALMRSGAHLLAAGTAVRFDVFSR